MEEAYQFIKENKDKNIFVHCVFGKSRSASVVIFYVMKEKKINFQEAKTFVKNIRNIVEPNSGFEIELNRYYNEHIAGDNNNNNNNNNNVNNNVNNNEIIEINEIKDKEIKKEINNISPIFDEI